MIHRAAWLIVVVSALACSKTGDDPGLGSGGAAGGGPFDASADHSLIDNGPRPSDGGPSRCGNGAVEAALGEACDDGNQVPDDGCTPLCQIECRAACGSCNAGVPCLAIAICGDGLRDGPEQCDDGNATSGDGCTAMCTLEEGWYCPRVGKRCVPLCGDGKVTAPETCDDGNDVGGDGCSAACLTEPTSARCGDSVVQGAEACDPPVAEASCAADCRYAHYCGDGRLDDGEECDLGLRKNTGGYGELGCTPTCTLSHYCGDGIVDADWGEQCDFASGNAPLESQCTAMCQLLLP